MYRHSGRLVDNNDVFILIYDIQRQLDRKDIRGALSLTDMNGESIVGVERSVHIGPDTVYEDALRHLFELSQVLAGIANAAEILFHPETVFIFFPVCIR